MYFIADTSHKKFCYGNFMEDYCQENWDSSILPTKSFRSFDTARVKGARCHMDARNEALALALVQRMGIKLIRTDTTLDLSERPRKVCFENGLVLAFILVTRASTSFYQASYAALGLRGIVYPSNPRKSYWEGKFTFADKLSFEFLACPEIALEAAYENLDSNVAYLEKGAYPALHEVQDKIRHLLDDTKDMAWLYLTRKCKSFASFAVAMETLAASLFCMNVHCSVRDRKGTREVDWIISVLLYRMLLCCNAWISTTDFNYTWFDGVHQALAGVPECITSKVQALALVQRMGDAQEPQ
ncbi:hypothetical protein VNO77_01047 [Canavalia gladiata]|uniref:Uncharacterized protein n=1 Tax=Canavalia gladiata TaxID=3824 RepID=A0AAN9MR78_CANGL